MTSRAWPLDRDDLLRRTLRLEVEPAHDAELVSKDDLFAALLAARPHILAEILLRAQNILRAMKQPDKAFRRHSEMYEYEKWTYRLGAYEGTLVETETTWQAIREQAKATLTESSAIVQAMRLVIGKRGSCIDRLSIAELFGLMQTAHADAGQQLIYRAANKLGMHLSNSGPSLDTIGVRHRRDGKSAYVVAQPSQAEIDRCVAMFNALRREQLARQAPWLAMVPEHAKTARPTIPESVDDFSDMPS
jgi:hypothetical protein